MSDTSILDSPNVPKFARWYLDLFTQGKTGRQKFGQQGNNMFGLLGTPIALLWAVFLLVFDFDGLWPAACTLLFIGVVVAFVPVWYGLGIWANIASLAFLLAPGYLLLTFLLGNETGINLYILIFPLAQLVLTSLKDSRPLMASTLISAVYVVIGGLQFDEPFLAAANNQILRAILYSNAIITVLVLCILCGYLVQLRAETAEDALAAEHARSEALLYNLLPEDIAARLKVEPDKTIADTLPNVAILFADIVDFTPRAVLLPPKDVVGFLNRIFIAFDELAEMYGLEKIKTIGDAYMAAAGMPSPVGDPVHRAAEMALAMQRTVDEISREFPEGLQVRIGLHAGPAVAGVIGNKKLFYDVWGETVNTASRMESHGEPGRIQVTSAAKTELESDYAFEPRGIVEVKGMGAVETWWLTHERRTV